MLVSVYACVSVQSFSFIKKTEISAKTQFLRTIYLGCTDLAFWKLYSCLLAYSKIQTFVFEFCSPVMEKVNVNVIYKCCIMHNCNVHMYITVLKCLCVLYKGSK